MQKTLRQCLLVVLSLVAPGLMVSAQPSDPVEAAQKERAFSSANTCVVNSDCPFPNA
jgi:hypothetical protein